MTIYFSYLRHINTLLCISVMSALFMAISPASASASTKGSPLITAIDEIIFDNPEIWTLIANDHDKETMLKEYRKIEKESGGLSAREIVQKASHCFLNRNTMEKGVMLLGVAMSRYDESLPEVEKLNCATAYGNMGYYLIFERNNPIQAYPFLVKGLEIANTLDLKDPELQLIKVVIIAGITTNIAKIFSIFRDTHRALHYYKDAYAIAKEDNNPVALPMAFTDLLNYAWTTDSIASIRKEIKEYDGLSIPNDAYRFMHDYAKMMTEAANHLFKQEYDMAIVLADSASAAIDPYVNDRRYIVQNRLITGKIAMEKQDFDKASQLFSEAEGLIRDGRLEDLYDIMYHTCTEFHKATGNPELAERYRYEGLRVRDSLQQIHSYGVIRNMELSVQAKDFNEKLSNSRRETQRWTYIALAAATLILVISLLTARIVIKNRRLKEKNESLFRKNLELMTLAVPKPNETVPTEPMPDDTAEKETSADDPETTGDHQEDSAQTYRRVLEYMAGSSEILSPSFTVECLADALGLKIKETSQAINTVGGKNFNTILGEYRIKKACEIMLATADDPTRRPTIEVLAEEVGYKSRTHFMRVFKNITGLTTTEFLRQATAK